MLRMSLDPSRVVMFSNSPSDIVRAQRTFQPQPFTPIISTMLSFVLAALALAQTAQATTDCRTALVGILSAEIKNATSGSTVYKSFTLNSANQTAYVGDGNNPLVVQFEECDSFLQGEAPTGYSVYGASASFFVPQDGMADFSFLRPPLRAGNGSMHRCYGSDEGHPAVLYYSREVRVRLLAAVRSVLQPQ